RRHFVSTAYWNSSVVTGENGKTSLRFKLPDNTTAWRLVVYGVNGEILVGKAIHSIQVKKDFFVELKAPKTLVAGDTPKPLVTVHNQTDKTLTASVSLTSSAQAGEGKTTGITLEIPAHTIQEKTFALDAVSEGQLKLTASVRAGTLSDSVERTVRVQPLATLVEEGIGGIVTQSFREQVKLPKTSEAYSNINLHLRYGPSLSSLLLEGELSPRFDGVTIASNGIAAYFTLRYLETLGASAKPYSARWFSSLESSALHFLMNQNSDGGFAYSGMNSQVAAHRLNSSSKPNIYSDPNIAALVLRVLVLAKQRGIAGLDDSITQNALYLKNAFSRATTNTEKATILYGMAGTQEIDFAHVNRLYRERNALDSYSLALLSLIFSAMDRKEYAKEVAELLTKRDLFQAPVETRLEEENKRRSWCWSSDPLELVALSANAFIQAGLPQSRVDGLIKYLFAHRGQKYWDSPKANAAAVEAIYQYLSYYKPAHQDKYKVEILVDDQLVHTAEVFGTQPIQELVPLSLKKPQATIEFRVAGSIQMSYQARISGWLKGIKEIQQNKIFYVKHYYNPSPLLMKGQEVPRGFGVLSGNYTTWKNEVHHLTEGDFTEVEIEYSPQRYYETYDSYLVLEEPLPGGATVLEPSIQGNFQSYEIRDGRIYFYLNDISGTLRYRLYGYLQGGYQILPSRVWNLFEPYRVSTGTPEKLTILSRGATNPDPFKHTPQELYYLGKFHFDEGQYPEAEKYLSELFKYENLQDSYYKDVVRMLLYTSIERNNSQDIVKYFEILKERDPSLFIDFERILKIGTAYGAIQEFERGLQVFKATTEANFSKEANVSGTLNEQGELESSIEFMRTLLQNYPDLPVVQTALYSLSQFVYESSAQVKQNFELQKKISCETLIQKAISLLELFLTVYPDNPMADEASFSLANIYLERKDFSRAVELGKIFTQRFQKSLYLDDFLYIEGYSNFYLREYEKALQQL
ncbi:MAG: alpha-2-macroglobulin family protein, partial [Planctomycetota bacterium]